MKPALFFIRIKEITNELLIADGWQPGLFVQDELSPYGPTFVLQDADRVVGYTTRAIVDKIVKDHGSPFVGTKFEVVEFTARLFRNPSTQENI